MTTATATTSNHTNTLFLKVAIAKKELTKKDAQRVLKAIKTEGGFAADVAESLGLLSTSARQRVQVSLARHVAKKAKSDERARLTEAQSKGSSETSKLKSDSKVRSKSDSKVRSTSDSKVRSTSDSKVRSKSRGKVRSKSDGKVRSKSDGKVKGRRRTPPPARTNPLPLIAAAVVAGALVGVGVMVGLSNPNDESPVAVVTPDTTPTPEAVVTPVPVESDGSAKQKKKLRADLEFVLSSSAKLRDLDKEKAALEIVDEFLTEHGDVPEALAARKKLMAHCATVIEERGAEAQKLADRGDSVAAAHMVANLRGRLPASFLPKINSIAVKVRETKGTKPAESKSEVRVAKADVADEPEEIEEPVAISDDETSGPAPEPIAVRTPKAKKVTPERKATPVRPEPEPEVEDEVEDEEDLSGLEDEDEADENPYDTTSPVAEALAQMVSVPHKLRRDGQFSVVYSMNEGNEIEDFESRNFDKLEIGNMEGVSLAARLGLECGAGSQRMGRLQHVVPLDGSDFEVELQMWLNYSNTRSMIVFTFGKKYGVNLGQQIVKVSKSGKLKPLSPPADRNMFREERLVKVKMTCVDGVLTVKCNGRKTAEKKLRAKDLKGNFGMIAKDVRMQITTLSIKGTIDTSGF